MQTSIKDYDYFLPPELVAQYPLAQRDASRLLVLDRATGSITHASFHDLPRYLDGQDLLAVNDTRVFPARLLGAKTSGGRIELLLHHLPAAEGGALGGGGQGPAAQAYRRQSLDSSPKPPPQNPDRGMGREVEERAAGAKAKNGLASPSESAQAHNDGGAEMAGGAGLRARQTLGRAESPAPTTVSALVRATYRGRLRVGQELVFGEKLRAEVVALTQPGVAEVRFCSLNGSDPIKLVLEQGEVPLPPYIHRAPEAADQATYQTVYASRPGAVACPTAGLHFTGAVLNDLARRGIDTVTVTLHVGPGTFMPVREEDYTRHRMHPEYFELSAAAAQRLNQARERGQRVVAVGTTSTRVLEYCAGPEGFQAQSGWCNLYIHPGYKFQAVDRLLTNFHLPKSTLLLLVSAFAGRDLLMRAYAEAVQEKYRFYSYGDCMLIL